MSNTTLTFFPNSNKIDRITGKTPLYLRVIIDRQKAEARLDKDYDLDKNDLLKWNQMSMRFNCKESITNDYLNEISGKFSRLKKEMDFTSKMRQPKEVVNIILGKSPKSEEILVIDYFTKYYKNYLENNGNYSKGTKRNYLKAITHFSNFLSFTSLKKLPLNNFTSVVAEDFKQYLENDYIEIEKKGMSKVSSSSIIKCLKPITGKALREEVIVKDPFVKIKLCNDSPNKKFLTITQVAAIAKVDLADNPYLIYYRDFFLFSIFTGLSFTDVNDLNRNTLIPIENDKIKLDLERTKTGKPVKQILNKYALEIVEKYKKNPKVIIQNTVFPKRSYDKINNYIKVVANKAGVGFNVTTSTARNTCRQLLAEAGLEDYLVINSFMGWSSGRLIHSRYYQVTESKLIELTNRYEDYLNKYLC